MVLLGAIACKGNHDSDSTPFVAADADADVDADTDDAPSHIVGTSATTGR
jgi:hypothetical protein